MEFDDISGLAELLRRVSRRRRAPGEPVPDWEREGWVSEAERREALEEVLSYGIATDDEGKAAGADRCAEEADAD